MGDPTVSGSNPVRQAPAKRLVLVLGMHRSGTSAAARALLALGVALGDTLIPASEAVNAKGFWEDVDINKLNVELLEALNRDWHSLALISPAELAHLCNSDFFGRAATLVRDKAAGHPVFGFKDPRLPVLLPFWKKVFAHCGFEVSCLLTLRHPLSVARSLEKRDKFKPAKSHLLWLTHVLCGLAGSRGLPRVLVDYDRLLQQPLAELDRIARGLDLSVDPREALEFQSAFLEHGLRHSVHTLDDLAADPACPPLVREVYIALMEVAAGRRSLDDIPLQEWLDELARSGAHLALIDNTQFRNLALSLSQREAEIDLLRGEATRAQLHIDALTRAVAERDSLVLDLRQLAARAEAQIDALTRAVAERDGVVLDLRQSAARAVAERDSVVLEFRRSTSWRITAPLRWLGGKVNSGKRTFRVAVIEIRRANGIANAMTKAVKVLLAEGWPGLRRRFFIARTLRADDGVNGYGERPVQPQAPVDSIETRFAAWRHVNGFNGEAAAALSQTLDSCRERLALISVIMPVYNTPAGMLKKAVGSVVGQAYSNWELLMVDDASTDPATIAALKQIAGSDARITVEFAGSHGNISRTTNSAAAKARGEFLAFLDHDDELAPDALAEVALAIAGTPEADYLYSDEDKIGRDGEFFSPQFKPDWSPALLLSYMYLGHIKVVRRSLFEQLGGFRPEFDGSQDYDFALRMSERARKVVHIPKVLYHWRAHAGSIAGDGAAKPESFDAGLRAVKEAVRRRGVDADVVQPRWAHDARLGIFGLSFPDRGPRVSIIIPTRNRVDLLRGCIESLGRTTYADYEIVVADNDSDDAATLDYLASLPHRVVRVPNPQGGGFNFANLVNAAVRAVDADYVLLLNNDTQVRTPQWLSQMMGYARMHGVGAVGARLLYPDGTLQHAGVLHGLHDGLAGHAFRHLPAKAHGYLCYAMVSREYSAVTAACLLTSREVFRQAGGFDEKRFPVAYNDVDYCYRLIDAGLRCIYCASAELFHLEGQSRGHADSPAETAAFRSAYRERIDPWYNANLSLDDEQFRIRPYHPPSRLTSPVRIVMASHNLNHEGAPICMLEIVQALKQTRVIDPVVVSPVDGPLRAEYERAGIPVRIIRHPLLDVRSGAQFDQCMDELGAALVDLRAEVVYGNTLQTFWMIAAGELAGLPTIWNLRESEPWQTYFDFLPPPLRQHAYACFAYPYRVVFVSNATRRAWSAVESRFNFTVVHDGLDAPAFESRLAAVDRAAVRRELGIGADEIVVLLVGTVCERKGQLDLVQALRDMPADLYGRLRAYIVGDRPSAYSSQLHEQVGALPAALHGRVVVVPETGAVSPYYKAADIALCTSRIESYPRIVLEAMVCGLPIVTTPVFGVVEQVRENVNAVFYQPGDTRALAAALATLAWDESLRARLAANSRLVFDSLTGFSSMLEGYARIFREARFSRGASGAACAGVDSLRRDAGPPAASGLRD